MHDNDMGCHLAVAARSGIGMVSQCAGCGCVHLTLAHVTVRLTPEALVELSQLLAVAQRRVRVEPAETSFSASPLAPMH
jgi:hypothetical protein